MDRFTVFETPGQERPVGIIWRWKDKDAMTGEVSIGGHGKDMEKIDRVRLAVFGSKTIKTWPKPRWVQVNKVRYMAVMERGVFMSELSRMRESGLAVQDVKTLGRLMR